MKQQIFVFGSNLAGRHGAGSAGAALRKHGAEYGVGTGLVGNSYAIPTKDRQLHTMYLSNIAAYVREFLAFAHANPEMEFNIVAIGCGLAGYTPAQIAPMFDGSPDNCKFINNWNLV